MNPFNPYSYVSLDGSGSFRGVTLNLPRDQVRALLPHGLELCEQELTPSGSHPVVVQFNDLHGAHMSVPSLLPSLSYHEQTLGVPYVRLRRTWGMKRAAGPFYFMPKLHLDSFLATLGGVVYWGYPKGLATFRLTENEYAVLSSRGTTITSLSFEPTGNFRPVADFPKFGPLQAIMNQPLVSQVPAAVGPFFVAAGFPKDWSTATLRPLRASMHVHESYAAGLAPGRFPDEGRYPDIVESELGAYELRTSWRLGMPFPAHLYWGG